MSGDEHDDSSNDDAAGHGAEQGGGAVGSVAGGAEEVLEGVGELLGDGEDTAEAREGLETAATVAGAVEDGARAVQGAQNAAEGIQSGDVGETAGGLGGALGSAGSGVGGLADGVAEHLPEGEAREALGTVGEVARAVGSIARGVAEIVEGGEELIESLSGGDEVHDVEVHLEIPGEEVSWVVRSLDVHEALSQLGEATLRASFPSTHPLEADELLGRDASLSIERGGEMRHYRGVIRAASVQRAGDDRSFLRLELVPALWLLTETRDSRVVQDRTVPQLVEELVEELLGPRSRTVQVDVSETYPSHEYLVQHRESHFDFIKRLCDEEGIFFYFDHDASSSDHEVLVLADENANRPLVRPDHDGVIQHEGHEAHRRGREVAFGMRRRRRVGASDAVVRGFDWTSPPLEVHDEQTEREDWHGARLEVYDHDHAIRHHEYDEGGGSYQSHTASRHSRLHAERLDLARAHWTLSTTAVGAQPGRLFELRGDDEHDGRYLIVSAHTSAQGSEHSAEVHTQLDVIPVDLPFRPPAPERRQMPGPETATVVGPSGEEIHTDQHGRIKVQFHWDRQGQRDERSSVWIRVSQSWAGAGWGTLFLPRIGMEVVVTFLGGDPERPLVTGCVYNGDNRVPYTLPDEKTKSTIKTNSSTGGGGYNELRFEDKSGEEEVWIHAQKDFNEVVEHCHTTHVKVDQTNTVDNDHTETVGNDQKLHVKNDRKKTIDKNETTEVGENRTETVTGEESIDLKKSRLTKIKENEDLQITGDRIKLVKGAERMRTESTRTVVVVGDDSLSVRDGGNRTTHTTGEYRIRSDGKMMIVQNGSEKVILNNDQVYVESSKQVHIVTRNSHLNMTSDGEITMSAPQKISFDAGGTKLELTPSGIAMEGPDIQATAGDSSLKLEASGAKLKGANADLLADTFATVKGILVRIN